MTEQELRDPKRKPSREGVLRAMSKVAEILPPTPLLPLEVDGRTLWCKAEMLQPIGAFKIRGAWHRISDLSDEERQRGVVGVSSGNHAQGVAWAAKRLGIPAIIVMPENAPKAKIQATQALGAEVVLYKRPGQDRDAIAAELVERTGGTLVHAFGDPWVIEGQGTLGLEAEAQLKARGLDGPIHIIACCGGGGLSGGLALACPEATLSIAEPEGWDDVIRSLAAGEIVSVTDQHHPTPCDALQTPRTYPINFDILKLRVASSAVVKPVEIAAAMRLAFEKLHLVVEPGGAAALAAVLAGKVELKATPVITLSGGNVDWDTYHAMVGGTA
ncbi:pyridoxal-phosphate dependent enzyme [Sphingorhabdus pulchriflava]|uniref:Pyridoxal-phosphate dependent enzyme n=1 Tax=Sphingorhabdus pulchriflava TaxID=2292257 RepID=A0A371BH39_9SPHN|nr:pyridoxal-phosphate dependent enzyme [Sphingorhabdus pulchriflava]RDV06896.1 pyridoxal-phosphate dependent enzyme [Sphingorhabdus pulchriflava]